jgi:hypothetical protein
VLVRVGRLEDRPLLRLGLGCRFIPFGLSRAGGRSRQRSWRDVLFLLLLLILIPSREVEVAAGQNATAAVESRFALSILRMAMKTDY